MNKNSRIKRSESEYNKFIGRRQGLDLFEQKLEAVRLINEVKSLDVDKDWQVVSQRMNQHRVNFRLIPLLTRIAAILTLPMLAFVVWSLFFQEGKMDRKEISQNEVTWQEVQCPEGMRSHVVLPDGTNLWLNAGSTLRYSIPFIRDKREVVVVGEAFLDVVKNENAPFIVKVGSAEIEVLGTRFNVNAWPEMDQIQIALKEGQVKFRVLEDQEKLAGYIMQPNEYLQYDKRDHNISCDQVNVDKYIAWHRNIMVLDDTPMTELARLLEQWYGVKVEVVNDDLKRYKFTTTFDNEPLHRVLELLEISTPGIRISYALGKPVAGSQKFSPSVVTITKK